MMQERFHHHQRTAAAGTSPSKGRQGGEAAARPDPDLADTVELVDVTTARRSFARLRLALGAVWLADGLLQWQPGTFHGFLGLVQQSAEGQPAPLHAAIVWGAGLLGHAPALANGSLAAVEVLIGLALLTGIRGREVLLASMLLAIPIWVFGEGMGQVFSGSTTDVGAAPLYALLALAVYVGGGWKQLNLVPALAHRPEPRYLRRDDGTRAWH